MIIPIFAALALADLPRLSPRGTHFVDPSGHTVLLKGCNIGNWLINEFWMFGTAGKPGVPKDQWSLEQTLSRRFGTSEDRRLMDAFRASWMTERDWQNIQSYHFNLIRLPFNYRLLEDDDNPMQLRPDAFHWLDLAVAEANRHGLYVILDLHGVQGGQTGNDHTGRSGQNKLWSDAGNQERMAWLWRQIAQHFRGRNNVVGYDPMNEPYGGTKSEVVAVFKKAYAAIRSADPDTLIFAHGATDNFDHFGDPKANGWHNVGFEMHYYPGLFGDAPRIKSNIRHLHRLTAVAAKIKALDVPFLVGEMNVVLSQSGGAGMMRRFFDAHASYGWLTTMWSYKVVSADGGIGGGSWGMFTNRGPAETVDFEHAPEPQIEAYFRSFATQELIPYEELRRDLTEAHPALEAIPADESPREVVPKEDKMPGWNATDVGGALKGGLEIRGDAFDLYGGGDDIWSSSDQFRFLNREVTGDFDLEVNLQSVEDTQTYTKSGLMVRSSLNADSATALLAVFSGGGVEIGIRPENGANMAASNGKNAHLPGAVLKITRRGDVLTFYVNGSEVTHKAIPALSGAVYVGPIALSHSNGELTKVVYQGLRLKRQ